jgi:hypothetical protein
MLKFEILKSLLNKPGLCVADTKTDPFFYVVHYDWPWAMNALSNNA